MSASEIVRLGMTETFFCVSESQRFALLILIKKQLDDSVQILCIVLL